MLCNTFLHIPGIGRETETGIWQKNILSWKEFLDNEEQFETSFFRRNAVHVKQSIEAYNTSRYEYFSKLLPIQMHWRAYPDLIKKCCFLDIETTGLDSYRDDVTVIGMYDGKESKIFVKGKNMDTFSQEMAQYDMIVTFNGRCFDVPFLKAKFPDVSFDMLHCDLRFLMRRIGYSGGLKRIEKMVGISRDDEIRDIDGYEAVRLWYQYKRGDRDALERLIEYNKADIENLKTLMDLTFQKLKEKEFLAHI